MKEIIKELKALQEHYEDLYQMSRKRCQPCGIEADRSQALSQAIKALQAIEKAGEELPKKIDIEPKDGTSPSKDISGNSGNKEMFIKIEAFNQAIDQIQPLIAKKNMRIKELIGYANNFQRLARAKEKLEETVNDFIYHYSESDVVMKLQQENKKLKEDYYELIMAVGNKYKNETRHQTALRYIKEAEKGESTPQQERKRLNKEE